MSEETHRSVSLTRTDRGHYEAVNPRGGRLHLGSGDDESFTPVELLLTAVAGCSAIDVDFITSKRSEPARFELRMTADKVRDEQGNHLTDLVLTFDVAFPEDEAGAAAASVLESAVKASHDRLCTVSRTVEIATPVEVRLA
jgi:putative redox protein